MSSISTVSSPAIRSFVEEAAESAPSTPVQPSVAAGVADATDEAPPVANEVLTRLGLLGLRSPGGTSDVSVLLAQTLFGTEETRGEVDKRRASIATNAALALAGRFNTAELQAKVTTKTGDRADKATDLKAAVEVRTQKKADADLAATQLSTKQGELAAAQTTLSNAKTDGEKAAAQAAVNRLTDEVATAQTTKTNADTAYAAAARLCTTLEGEIATLDGEIALLRGEINAVNSTLLTVSLLFASRQTNTGEAHETRTKALDLDSEKLFEAIGRLSLENARNANPLLREDGAAEAADEPPPSRPAAVATALQVALADLLRELNSFDPLLLARPPEQTGLDRLRLRV